MRFAILIASVLLVLDAIAYAQGVGSECVPEIKAFCMNRSPGRERIECLKQNRSKASPACKKFIDELSK
jgi:hypothetical protein